MLKSLIYFLFLVFTFSVSATENVAELEQQLDNIRHTNTVSAAVVLIVDKDKVLLNAHLGKPHWDSTQLLTPEHMFRIGSISKTFAGLLALRMQEQGLIDINKPFTHYVKKPLIKNTFDGDITLAQLLEHTAGLQDLQKSEWDYNDKVTLNLEQSFALKLGAHTTQWPSGLHSSYSNVGAGLLGLALEKAGGKPYEALMDEHVFNPLGLKLSTLLLTDEVKDRLITGYNTDGKTKIPYWHNIYRPFAAINTDASDMTKFLQLFLNSGLKGGEVFLSPASLERMQTPQTTLAGKSGLKYGYGLGNYQWQKQGTSFHGHGGDADGYLTHFGYKPETGQAYFVMINAFKHKPLGQMRNLIEAYMIKDLPKPHYPKREKLSKDTLQQYVGDYIQVTKRFGPMSVANKKLKVFFKGGQLYTQESKKRGRVLFAVKHNEENVDIAKSMHFRRTHQSVATLAFVEYEDDIYLQGDIGNFIRVY